MRPLSHYRLIIIDSTCIIRLSLHLDVLKTTLWMHLTFLLLHKCHESFTTFLNFALFVSQRLHLFVYKFYTEYNSVLSCHEAWMLFHLSNNFLEHSFKEVLRMFKSLGRRAFSILTWWNLIFFISEVFVLCGKINFKTTFQPHRLVLFSLSQHEQDTTWRILLNMLTAE